MQFNGNGVYHHPPDYTAILLDQNKELRNQSNALGWIMSQLSTGSEVHRELKADVKALKDDMAQLRASQQGNKPAKFKAIADSLSGLLHAGIPYLVCFVLVAGKLLGLGPSWIEPLIERLAKALLS